jgi:hypothetical protein
MAALERAVADDLKGLGYAVLGTHPRVGTPKPDLLAQIRAILKVRFPSVRPNNALQPTPPLHDGSLADARRD